MKLRHLEFKTLHFPETEWQWVRPSIDLSTTVDEIDFFLWGATVQDRLYCWHPSGCKVTGIDPNEKINVIEIENIKSELDAHSYYLKTTFSFQKPHDVEWVSALDVLENHFKYNPTNGKLPLGWTKALEASGLEPHLGILAQRKRFQFLNQNERALLFNKKWALATFELLETWPANTRSIFIQKIKELNFSANQAKDAANHIFILLKKLGTEATETLLQAKLKTADEYRVTLFKAAQPELANMSAERVARLRNLKTPPRTSVFGDPNFERDILKITHLPRNPADFERFKTWVQDEELTAKVKDLLAIYQS